MDSTAPKPFVFVLMPFDPEFDDVYELGIKAACQRAGTHCERVDKQIFQEIILQKVYEQVLKADVVVADLSGRNANVFYEVGYAHASGKIVVLIAKSVDDIPYDLQNYQCIIYDRDFNILREQLAERIACFCENRDRSDDDITKKLRIYANGCLLEEGAFVGVKDHESFQDIEFAMQNVSDSIVELSKYKLGLVVPAEFLKTSSPKVVELHGEEKRMVYICNDGVVFPKEWIKTSVELFDHVGFKKTRPTIRPASMRIFTATGMFEIFFRLAI